MVYLWCVYHFKGGAWFGNRIPTVCNGVCTVPRVGLGARARCDVGVDLAFWGRPRCDTRGAVGRPRCDGLGINRVVLELAVLMVCYGVCIYSVCVGVEYFNYACRLLPFPNFFLQSFCGKPCLTVQKML